MNGLCRDCGGGHAPASERLAERVLLAMEMEFAVDPVGRNDVRRSGSAQFI